MIFLAVIALGLKEKIIMSQKMKKMMNENGFVEHAEMIIDKFEQEGFYYDDSVVGNADKFKRLWDEFRGEILGEFDKLCGGFIRKR